MRVNAGELFGFGLIDEVIPENPAAHEDPAATISAAGDAIERHLIELEDTWKRGATGERAILEARYAKYRAMGEWQEAQAVPTPAAIGRR